MAGTVITLPPDRRWGELGAGLGNLLGSAVNRVEELRVMKGVSDVQQDPTIPEDQKYNAVASKYGAAGAAAYQNMERARIAQEQLRGIQEERQAGALAFQGLLNTPAGAALGMPQGGLPGVARAPLAPTPGGAADTVRGSWFGNAPGWVDPSDSGLQASGKPVSAGPGIALPSRATLGQDFDVTAPSGQTYRLKQTDVGPAAKTGRGVDINAPAAQLMGYTPKTFPTDASFKVAPAGSKAEVRANDIAQDALEGITAAQYGAVQRKQLAEAIEKANPNAPAYVKMQAFERASKVLAPEERQAWELEKVRMNADLRVGLEQLRGQQNVEIAQMRGEFGKQIAEMRGERQNWQVYQDPSNSNKPYRMNAATGETLDFEGQPYTPGGVQKPTGTAGGRQAETMGLRITQAANETVAALGNLVDLPIGATTGWFMGVQTDKPRELGTALQHSLASTLTSDQTKAVITSYAGVARSLAILEAAGSAQGLVGLSQQAQVLAPQEGDSGITVLRKYAEVRQIVDRAVDTLKAAPSFQNQPQMTTLLNKIQEEVSHTVPWTVKDVNALQRNPTAERAQDFAQRMQVAGGAHRQAGGSGAEQTVPKEAIDMLKANPTPEQRANFDDVFGKGAADRVLK